MLSSNDDWEGWIGLDESSAEGKMIWTSFQPKAWEETDVDIKVSHCGVCQSDLHLLNSGWRPTDYPTCVGHEIVGTIVRVGSKAENGLQVGDRVGVGAQGDSCLGRLGDCDECSTGNEQYCSKKFVGSCYDKHLNGDKAYGGFAKFHRSPSHFVVRIPDGLKSEDAAPMLCGGVTMFSALKRSGCGPEKVVGVIGIGGLGHFGLLWAKAMKAKRVIAISRKDSKRGDAMNLGADEYIATEDDPDWTQKHARSLDILISTVSSSKCSVDDYLSLLRTNGELTQVGNPDDGVFEISASALLFSRARFGGSVIGSPQELREMLGLAAENDVRPHVEVRRMKDANQTLVDMAHGKARYRYVLEN